MLFGSLIIDFFLVGFGALMRSIAVEPSHIFGYRSPRSIQNNATWNYSNQRCGSLFIVLGLIGLALTAFTEVLRVFTPFTASGGATTIAAFLSMGIPLIGAFVAVVAVEKGLKARFGNANKEVGVTEAPIRSSRDTTPFIMNKEERITFASLCALPLLIAVVGFAILPDTIAVHFDAVEPDDWVSKIELFLFSSIIALCNGGIIAAYRVFLKQWAVPSAGKSRVFACFGFGLLMLANSTVVLAVILYNLGW